MKRLLLVSLLVSACGGDNMHTPDGAPPLPDGAPNPDGAPGASMGVIAAGDFNVSGILSTVSVPAAQVQTNVAGGIVGADPFLRHVGKELYIINRGSGDNVTIVADSSFAFDQQIATGTGGNPQDIAVVGRKLYVAELAATGVVVIDRNNPTVRTTIDLTALDAVDGHPDCVSVYAVDTRVFVACGVLDDQFKPRGNGKIAVIDTTSDTVTTTFDLPGKNPQGFLTQVPGLGGDLVIGLEPDFQDYSTGCVARVSTGATPAANGCAVTNAALGGLANHTEVSPDGTALWIDVNTYDASFTLSGRIVALDLGTMQLAPKAMTPPSVIATDLAACPDGLAVVVDRTTGATGVRIFRPNGDELTHGALDIGATPDYGNNIACY